VKTIAFSYYQPSFAEYNVAQSAAIPYLDKDMNLVISFATAAGKTVLAECCFAYHLKTNENSKVAYVCPFKSLASEKYQAWQNEPQLSKYGLVMGTSDTDTEVAEYYAARLAVVTTESFDSKTRSASYREWIGSLSCVCFDEAHLLGDKGRGSALEASIMRIARENPRARLVLLSATMSNAIEIAKWVKSLNGKDTKCITSAWRPVKVEKEYHIVSDSEEKVEKAIELAAKNKDMKTIVFVHSKITGAIILKRLRACGVRCVFHNASLSLSRRKKIEERFSDRMSGLNVLISTSTLGAGVNLCV
jgi:replicative superfamily II helicase